MNYWKECISEAFDEEGIIATEDQLSAVAVFVNRAHECYGDAHGYDVISKGADSAAEQELKILKAQIQREQDFINDSTPCRPCTTTGHVKDGWGREQTCFNCSGKGRVIMAPSIFY